MRYYPLFLDLAARDVLVVGAGEVGQRKIASLLTCSPQRIVVVDPSLTAEAAGQLEGRGSVFCHARAFEARDIAGKALVFAATASREVNALVAALCEEQGVLCNIADAPDSSSFFVPAHFSQGEITVALSTGGHSPALARRLREELEAWLGNRYSGLVVVLGRLRPLLLQLGLPTKDNTVLFRALVNSALAEHLEKNDRDAAMTLLTHHLPEPLHPRMGELLHGL